MDIIQVDEHNIEQEHICCAITESSKDRRVETKKSWMKQNFSRGLVFRKLDVRGKVFIEYLPVENAWCPVEGKNHLFINCFWVSGKYKGQGYANQLLEACIKDAETEDKDGILVVSSTKKLPFLSDPKYLKYKGFETCDVAHPTFELLHLPLKKGTGGKFKDCCKEGVISDKHLTLYHTNQCPHAEMYSRLFEQICQEKKIPFQRKKISSLEEAKQAPSPFTTYALFYQGKFITNEILGEKKIYEFLDKSK